MTKPLSIITQRADVLESEHLVDAVICNDKGEIITSYGDANRLVFPRSAIKPLQAIALIEAELSDMGGCLLSDEAISVICASHNGEAAHIDAVSQILASHRLDPAMLHCGAHWSNHQDTCRTQARQMDAPQKIHNNCSGKHAGMLLLGQKLGGDITGYHQATHKVQQAIIAVINDMAGVDIMDYPCGIDGCGAPAFSAPMTAWATAFARFTKTDGTRGKACQHIAQAIANAPFLMAGTGRACSAVNQAYGAEVTVKIGAEGVYGIAAHRYGLGAMLKVRDGNMRIAEVALGRLLQDMGVADKAELSPYFAPMLQNWAGEDVGRIIIA